jgi:hypothetical protein
LNSTIYSTTFIVGLVHPSFLPILGRGLLFVYLIFLFQNWLIFKYAVTSVKAIFQSVNSPPQLGWPANGDDDPCGQSWKGITCSANRVTQMYVHFQSATLLLLLSLLLVLLSHQYSFLTHHQSVIQSWSNWNIGLRITRLNISHHSVRLIISFAKYPLLCALFVYHCLL